MTTRYVVIGMETSKPYVEPVDGPDGHLTYDEAVRSIIGFQHKKKEQAEDALTWIRSLARAHHGQPDASFVK
jgi:hypothetical protein